MCERGRESIGGGRMCVCVRARENGVRGESERGKGEYVCVSEVVGVGETCECVCVCVRAREQERLNSHIPQQSCLLGVEYILYIT